MIKEFVSEQIATRFSSYDVIVLKGFDVDLIHELAETYNLIDFNIYQDGKINLEAINPMSILMALNQNTNRRALMSYESFLSLVTNMRNLNVFGKTFCVLTNNMLSYYLNPSTASIPDFEADGFEDCENEAYGQYYAYCMHKNGNEYIQYINYELEDDSVVYAVNLIEPKNIDTDVIEQGEHPAETISISHDDGSVESLLDELYSTMDLQTRDFTLADTELAFDNVKVLYNACMMLHLSIHLWNNKEQCIRAYRSELEDILNERWGYPSFRKLEIYKDPAHNYETTEISQGEVIETVIQQSEAALSNDDKTWKSAKNILLTAPTGAGKSLLFQLAAIYLGEKYGALTIVVSPLVALMEDQVDNLRKRYDKVAALNGNRTIVEKEQILENVRNGNVNILYLAPELLLSYTLDNFIGNRRVGLFVVDEAHTVTTWGRDFRVDYWFLGDYLRSSRRYNTNQHFPIFALTATAVYDPAGGNDMVFDTIRSLYMDPCKMFIGVVRREDITFDIENIELTGTYDEARMHQSCLRIIEAIEAGRKTIFYFPYKSHVDSISHRSELAGYLDRIALYHADLSRQEKNEYANDFRTGRRIVMCATKAYGMGVDISDIEVVYHHTPNGSLSDYVQEIGRVARDEDLQGVAQIDFSTKDLRYSRKLHGLSAIKPYQLRAVLTKVIALYHLKGDKQNMLINVSDFEYIFPGKDVDYDQKVKSSLMLICKDLLQKLGYPVLIVRPKNIFSKMYIGVNENRGRQFFETYGDYLTRIDDNRFVLDSDRLWEKEYRNMSFASFKKAVIDNKIFSDYKITILNKVTVKMENIDGVRNSLREFFEVSNTILDAMTQDGHRRSIEGIKNMLPKVWKQAKKELFVQAFALTYATGNDAVCKVYVYNNTDNYQLNKHGYYTIGLNYLKYFDNQIRENEITKYCSLESRFVRLVGILNALDLVESERMGGDIPSIFVRLNNPPYLSRLARNRNYENDILMSIYRKYELSESIFTYFFTKEMTNKMRWDFIEAYFLGEPEDSLLHWVESHSNNNQ